MCSAAAPLLTAAVADDAITAAFRLKNRALGYSGTLLRYAVSEELEAVIALGSPRRMSGQVWWTPETHLGLFLQDKSRPELVYTLAMIAHQHESLVTVERAEAGLVVLSRRGEKSNRIANLKLVFDARSKRLIRQMEYVPFFVPRVVTNKGIPQFIATDGRQELVLEPSAESFKIVAKRSATPDAQPYFSTMSPPPPGNLPPLPETAYEAFARVRPERVRNGYVREGTEFHERIGPRQRFHGKLWFGKTFYDGEGSTGIGGFGYFDPARRKYIIYSPPEVVDWSTSAILVTPEAVWLGLCFNGEWGGASGGLLRWDHQTHDVREYPTRSIIGHIVAHNGRVSLATSEGVAIVRDDRLEEFFVDVNPGGAHGVPELARKLLQPRSW